LFEVVMLPLLVGMFVRLISVKVIPLVADVLNWQLADERSAARVVDEEEIVGSARSLSAPRARLDWTG
jgi:hypothetical protein